MDGGDGGNGVFHNGGTEVNGDTNGDILWEFPLSGEFPPFRLRSLRNSVVRRSVSSVPPETTSVRGSPLSIVITSKSPREPDRGRASLRHLSRAGLQVPAQVPARRGGGGRPHAGGVPAGAWRLVGRREPCARLDLPDRAEPGPRSPPGPSATAGGDAADRPRRERRDGPGRGPGARCSAGVAGCRRPRGFSAEGTRGPELRGDRLGVWVVARRRQVAPPPDPDHTAKAIDMNDHSTNTEEAQGDSGNPHTAVLSALLDHEPVDPDALSAALDDAEARAALVDFVRLRQGLGQATEVLPASLQTLGRRPLVRAV